VEVSPPLKPHFFSLDDVSSVVIDLGSFHTRSGIPYSLS